MFIYLIPHRLAKRNATKDNVTISVLKRPPVVQMKCIEWIPKIRAVASYACPSSVAACPAGDWNGLWLSNHFLD